VNPSELKWTKVVPLSLPDFHLRPVQEVHTNIGNRRWCARIIKGSRPGKYSSRRTYDSYLGSNSSMLDHSGHRGITSALIHSATLLSSVHKHTVDIPNEI
jgi:hypothetical protein